MIAQRAAVATISPRHDAQLCRLGAVVPTHPRDQILQRIDQIGRLAWNQERAYHRRSSAESTMFRLNVTFGGRVRSCTFDNQAIELFLQCAALNCIIQLAKPDRYRLNFNSLLPQAHAVALELFI